MPSESSPILNDPDRLEILKQTALLDSPPEESFDRLARLAARLLNAPVALVSLVDGDRQFFKSRVGLPEQVALRELTPLTHSFCKHVVVTAEPLIVDDARQHPILRDNLAVPFGVIAYAGIPLITQEGQTLGSFCAIDNKARTWTVEEIATLAELAGCVMTEINLRRSKEVAEAESAAKDKFLAFLSHELRGPLTPALLTAAAIEDDASMTQHVRDEASIIRKNIQLATHLADDLLDVTRLAAGKLEPHLQNTDLHSVVNEAIVQCSASAAAKPLYLSTELNARRHQMRGDGPRLIQVVRNVLSNSIKFTPAGGSILVRTNDAAGDTIQIDIIDTGEGIEPAFLSKMFIPYQQGNRGATRDHLGLGLGLAICKGIVDVHHGMISATSAGKGHGTTITIRLPVLPYAESAVLKTVPAAVKPSSTNLRIMLVEDHVDTRKIMARLLTKLDHSVVTAGSIEEALATACDCPLDLVISDIGLPDGTGLDLMRQLLTNRTIPGIALTGYGTEADTEQTRAAGFTAHLTKPIDFKELIEVIGRVTCGVGSGTK
jgi:signal transduction histidine kinase/CheY-like chemotaxis protein